MTAFEAAEQAHLIASVRMGMFEDYGFMCAVLLAVAMHLAWHSWLLTIVIPVALYAMARRPYDQAYEKTMKVLQETPMDPGPYDSLF